MSLAFCVLLLTWLTVGFWNAVKPLPPGTHVQSVSARVTEAEVEILADGRPYPSVLSRQLESIQAAAQLVVLDQSPLPREIAQCLLLRKHAKPNLKILVVTDPADELDGGTPVQDLELLERSGVIVVRVDLDRLRDSNPIYSGLWRSLLSWWSTPQLGPAGVGSLLTMFRRLNFKADGRQLLVADDGQGGWISIIGAPERGPAVLIRGALATDILASELKLAAWSQDDDRLPAVPPAPPRRMGTVDARFLSEGAIEAAWLDALGAADRGDRLSITAHILAARRALDALRRAAARGVQIRLLLDQREPNAAAAADLDVAGLEVRWRRGAAPSTQLTLWQHGGDALLLVSSAALTRRDLKDFNLESAIELRMPARAAAARNTADLFANAWSQAGSAAPAPSSDWAAYWRYRIGEATGLAGF